MPQSVLYESSVWKSRRLGNTGSAMTSKPRSRAIKYEDIDISPTSNSWNLSWRQNVSDGWEYVGTISMPSASTAPFISGSTLSLKAEMKIRLSLTIAIYLMV